jgi:hypothetical protein
MGFLKNEFEFIYTFLLIYGLIMHQPELGKLPLDQATAKLQFVR